MPDKKPHLLFNALSYLKHFPVFLDVYKHSQIHKWFMKRKQRKTLPWRRFGYVILIIIKFSELFLWFSPRIISALRSYIKHSKECFIRYPNTSKLVKKNSAAPRLFNPLFSVWISDDTLFLVFDILQKESMFTVRILIIDDKFIATSSSRQNGAGSEFGADPTHI